MLAATITMGLCCLTTPSAYAEWETGVRTGYNSNVDHSIRDPQSDSYVSGYLSYAKGISGESRLNWTFDANLEGVAYLRNEGLSYGELTLSPALVYFLHRDWAVSISPFVQGRAVKDSDQSALTLGGKVTMRERLNPTFYLSQFYMYRNAMASSSVYSTWEHALGAVLGANWTKRFFTELGYEFSRGESFRSLDNSTTADKSGPPVAGNGNDRGAMRGSRAKFSSTFDTIVFREVVDRHAVGITFGLDWTKALYSTAGYTYGTMKGESGTSHDQAGFVTLGYRF
jgi:hypothetical protein